jgi:hypothetical protein
MLEERISSLLIGCVKELGYRLKINGQPVSWRICRYLFFMRVLILGSKDIVLALDTCKKASLG